MPHYLITYDNKPPRNYEELYRLMVQWGAVKLSQSVWLATLNGPAGQIRNILSGVLQSDDLVSVVELKPGSDWATNNVSRAATIWLSENIQTAELPI